jgi:toxin ParE1/3/4
MAYVADDDLGAAVSLIDRFYRIFALLADNPKAGRERPELETGLRSLPEASYIIFYRIWAGEVAISRVVHAARDLDEIFS